MLRLREEKCGNHEVELEVMIVSQGLIRGKKEGRKRVFVAVGEGKMYEQRRDATEG